jgi:hypothetical protein
VMRQSDRSGSTDFVTSYLLGSRWAVIGIAPAGRKRHGRSSRGCTRMSAAPTPPGPMWRRTRINRTTGCTAALEHPAAQCFRARCASRTPPSRRRRRATASRGRRPADRAAGRRDRGRLRGHRVGAPRRRRSAGEYRASQPVQPGRPPSIERIALVLAERGCQAPPDVVPRRVVGLMVEIVVQRRLQLVVLRPRQDGPGRAGRRAVNPPVSSSVILLWSLAPARGC